MKNILSIVLIAFLFSSCGQEVNINQLVEKNSVCYKKGSAKPYTGIAYWKIKNIEGKPYRACDYTFKEGVPDGPWKAFDFDHNTIAKGSYTVVKEIAELKSLFPNLQRVNIDAEDLTVGGDAKTIGVVLISDQADSTLFRDNKERILQFLIDKKYLPTTGKVRKVFLCDTEVILDNKKYRSIVL